MPLRPYNSSVKLKILSLEPQPFIEASKALRMADVAGALEVGGCVVNQHREHCYYF